MRKSFSNKLCQCKRNWLKTILILLCAFILTKEVLFFSKNSFVSQHSDSRRFYQFETSTFEKTRKPVKLEQPYQNTKTHMDLAFRSKIAYISKLNSSSNYRSNICDMGKNQKFFGGIYVLSKRKTSEHVWSRDIIDKHELGDYCFVFLSLIVMLKFFKKLQKATLISLYLLFLIPFTLASPVTYTTNSTASGSPTPSGALMVGISAVKNQHYCTIAYYQEGAICTYLISKFDSSGNFIAQDLMGSFSMAAPGPTVWHTVLDINGGCVNYKINYPSSVKTGTFDFCTGVSSCPEYSWTTGAEDAANKLVALASGSYLLVGYTQGTNSVVIHKITTLGGGFDWSNTFSNFSSQAAVELSNGNLIIAGTSTTSLVYMTLTSLGVQINQTTLAAGIGSSAREMIVLSNGLILIVGSNTGVTPNKAQALIVDLGGNITGNYKFGGASYDLFNDALQHPDGTIYMAGTTALNSNGPSDAFLVAMDLSGNMLWQALYGGSGGDAFVEFTLAQDNTLVCVGYSSSPPAVGVNYYQVTVYLQCPPGQTVNPSGFGCGSSISCNVGNFYSSTLSSCQPCWLGSNSSTVGVNCSSCPLGYYQDQLGQTTCKICGQGLISTTTGATACTACPSGTYQCNTGQGFCSICPRTYCGPCQLNDRSLCLQLNNVCWLNYTNGCELSPRNSSDCYTAIATICYNIWVANGTYDPQCVDFTSVFNFALMQAKPTLLSASYANDGQSFFLTFDQAINQIGFTDASAVFSDATLNWLPSSRIAKWLNQTTLQVTYQPQAGIMPSLTLKQNAIYSTYLYAQVAASATNFPVFYLFQYNLDFPSERKYFNSNSRCYDRCGVRKCSADCNFIKPMHLSRCLFMEHIICSS